MIFEPKLVDDTAVVEDILNQRLSGGWLITAINFRFNPADGLKQEVVMVKRELTVNNYNV